MAQIWQITWRISNAWIHKLSGNKQRWLIAGRHAWVSKCARRPNVDHASYTYNVFGGGKLLSQLSHLEERGERVEYYRMWSAVASPMWLNYFGATTFTKKTMTTTLPCYMHIEAWSISAKKDVRQSHTPINKSGWMTRLPAIQAYFKETRLRLSSSLQSNRDR